MCLEDIEFAKRKVKYADILLGSPLSRLKSWFAKLRFLDLYRSIYLLFNMPTTLFPLRKAVTKILSTGELHV